MCAIIVSLLLRHQHKLKFSKDETDRMLTPRVSLRAKVKSAAETAKVVACDDATGVHVISPRNATAVGGLSFASRGTVYNSRICILAGDTRSGKHNKITSIPPPRRG